MRLKDSQYKRTNSLPLWLHHSQKRWMGLPFFAFIGLTIFLLCNSSSIYAGEATTSAKLKIDVFEQKGSSKVPLEGAGIFLNGIFYDSTDTNGKVTLKDVPIGSHMLEVKKLGFNTYKAKVQINAAEFAERAEVVLIREIPSESESLTVQKQQKRNADEPKNEGTLKITVSGDAGEKLTGANVYLDGKFLGQTKDGIIKARRSPGTYKLKVEKNGFLVSEDEAEIKKTEYLEEKKITLKKEQMKPKETIKTPAAVKDKKTITSADNKSTDAKDTSKPEGDIFLTVKVFEDTGSGRLPVRNAKILIDGGLCGETDENGLFKRKRTPGECKLQIEKEGFNTEYKMFALSSYSDSFEVALRKTGTRIHIEDYYVFIIIGSIIGSLGIIALVVILFAKKKGGTKETIFIDSMGDEHTERIQKIHVRFRPFKHRKGMSLIYLGRNPFNIRQEVVFKVLKEEHHNEDGLWLFDNEKRIHLTLKNNGVNKGQTHLAQYLYSGYLVRNKKQKVIAFEYIEGVSLFEIIGARKHTLQQAIEIGIWLCDPVMAVHHAGYCHLDLKPEHFIYKGQNRFTLIDIATALRVNDSVVTMIKSPPYSSPEQLSRGSMIDQRTDIYSLGVIIEELSHSSTIGYLNSALISVVQGIIERMKNKDPNARYQHIGEVKANLEMILRSFVNT